MTLRRVCYNPASMIILASNSPRRKELLALTGWDFRVDSMAQDERQLPGEQPLQYVRRVAIDKASCSCAADADGVIVAADTIVLDGEGILGKPDSREDAVRILQRLRGRSHQVLTSVVIRQPKLSIIRDDLCVSSVRMRKYSDAELEEYVATGDPLDKAGAYAVQNRAFHPVTGFRGCFANVMGLPLCHLARSLATLGITAVVDIPSACQEHLQYHCKIHARILSGKNAG
jgi:septum formation protein